MVERNEVAQMSKFMSALNESGTASTPVDKPQVNEMKAILERFHSVTDNIVNETSYPELREALMTERTNHGARVGLWEIHHHQSGKRQFYDVIHTESGEQLANDLMLYEVAHGLVRILNNGGYINCREAVEYLRSDQDYAASVHDMVLFRHRMTQHPNSRRANIFEARYSESKRRAIKARNTAQNLFSKTK